MVESDDPMFKLQYLIGVILNTMIILQFGCYWTPQTKNNKKVVYDDKKAFYDKIRQKTRGEKLD